MVKQKCGLDINNYILSVTHGGILSTDRLGIHIVYFLLNITCSNFIFHSQFVKSILIYLPLCKMSNVYMGECIN